MQGAVIPSEGNMKKQPIVRPIERSVVPMPRAPAMELIIKLPVPSQRGLPELIVNLPGSLPGVGWRINYLTSRSHPGAAPQK